MRSLLWLSSFPWELGIHPDLDWQHCSNRGKLYLFKWINKCVNSVIYLLTYFSLFTYVFIWIFIYLFFFFACVLLACLLVYLCIYLNIYLFINNQLTSRTDSHLTPRPNGVSISIENHSALLNLTNQTRLGWIGLNDIKWLWRISHDVQWCWTKFDYHLKFLQQSCIQQYWMMVIPLTEA